MELNTGLYEVFLDRAKNTGVEIVSIGLGYTAVTTGDGGIGLSYTYFGDKRSCMILNEHIDYEAKPASLLLEKIKSDNSVERSMALALINALNYDAALALPEDKNNNIMYDKFKIGADAKIAMVGFFGPLVRNFREKRIPLEILDESRDLGHKQDFYHKLGSWANVLLLTSTSILNQSTEEILANVLAASHRVLLVLAVGHLFHALGQQSLIVLGQQWVPVIAPDHLDDVPSRAAESRFELLDNLAITTYRPIQALQVTINHKNQIF